MDLRRLVFIDESSAKTNMMRLDGRAYVGRRVRDAVPTATWNTPTMLAAIGADGARAPFVREGALDGAAFEIYVKRILAPTLKAGDIVVMDNLSSHQNSNARKWIEAAGATIWDLPPYSPDLNPIELMWSKVKALLRKAQGRSFEEWVQAVGAAIQAVTIKDIHGWFNECGYKIT